MKPKIHANANNSIPLADTIKIQNDFFFFFLSFFYLEPPRLCKKILIKFDFVIFLHFFFHESNKEYHFKNGTGTTVINDAR